MGQDSSCGICGKHYQDCQHFMRTHIRKDSINTKTFCGRYAHKCDISDSLEEYDSGDTDPDDFCRNCAKAIGRPPGTVLDEYLDLEEPMEYS